MSNVKVAIRLGGERVRMIPLFILACSARRVGEFCAHSSSRAARALVVAIIVAVDVGDCSAIVFTSWPPMRSTSTPTLQPR
jgi:hypothetical protein